MRATTNCVSRCQTALFIPATHSRPGLAQSPPIEGWAERRQAHIHDHACEAWRVPCAWDARLSALHRGDFRPGAALPSPAFPPDPFSELLAARSWCLAGGTPGLSRLRLRAGVA